MYFNTTLHVPSNMKMNNLDREVPVHIHVPSEKKDFLDIIKAFPEIIIMPSIALLVFLSFKAYHLYSYSMDTKTIVRRIYLLEHKVFPCPNKRKLHNEKRFDHELTHMWNHYMHEDHIYHTLLKAREYRRLIKDHMDVISNLDMMQVLPHYNAADDGTIYPMHLTWAEYYKRKTHGQILIKYVFQLAIKDNFSVCRLDRVDDILLAIQPENFVGAFWDRKTSTYVVIGQPQWWDKSMYAPGDKKKITYTNYKILDEDYRRAFISDDE